MHAQRLSFNARGSRKPLCEVNGGNAPSNVVGLDVGSSSIKASVVSQSGQCVGSAAMRVRRRKPRRNYLEYEVEEVALSVFRVLREALDCAQVGPNDVAAIGVASTRSSFALVDEQFRPLGPVFGWEDTRGGKHIKEFVERMPGGAHAYRDLTGWRPSSVLTLSTLLWLKRYRPELLMSAWKLATLQSIAFGVLGAPGAPWSRSMASSSGLYSLEDGAMSGELLSTAEVPLRLFPELRTPPHVVGAVSVEASKHVGVSPGTPLVLAPCDAACVHAGVGALGPSSVVVSLGSGSSIALVTDRREPAGVEAAATWPHCTEERWCLNSNIIGTGAGVEWVLRMAGEQPQGGIQRLVEMAGRASSTSEEIILSIRSRGAAANGRHLDERDLRDACTPSQIARAGLEGLVIDLTRERDNMLASYVTREPYALVGGGSNEGELCQMLADAFAVTLSAHPDQTRGAVGVAAFAALSLGWGASLEQLSRWFAPPDALIYKPRDKYARYYTRLLQLHAKHFEML